MCVCGSPLQVGGVQESLKPAAALSIVVYMVGLPVTFFAILLKYRVGIRADQTLRVASDGNTAASNPNLHIRKRYQELYRCVAGCRQSW
jgi:hypothetical protein